MRFLFFASLVGVFLLAAVALQLAAKRAQSTEAAGIFQDQYLGAIQHAIDLSKNLNSHGDFILDQIKSPRNRDASIFVENAQSSLNLLLVKESLAAQKKKDIQDGMKRLMGKADLVLKHVEEGDLELARKIYTQEYVEELKTFHMDLDSHKKLIQNQASHFFSKHLAATDELSAGAQKLVIILLGGCLLFMSGLVFAFKRVSKKDKGRARELESKEEAMLDQGYRMNDVLHQVRELCESGLAQKFTSELNGLVSYARVRSFSGFDLPSVSTCDIGIEESVKTLLQECSRIERKKDEANAKWTQASSKLATLAQFRATLVNMALREGEGFSWSAQLLDSLDELEAFLKSSPFEGIAGDELSRTAIEIEKQVKSQAASLVEQATHFQARVSEEQRESALAQKRLEELALESAQTMEKLFVRRSEYFTRILILTDPHELDEETSSAVSNAA